MDSSKVIPIIRSLIEEINYVLEELNQQGARKFFASDYTHTKELLKNVEEVSLIKEKAVALSDGWKRIDFSVSIKKGPSDNSFEGQKKTRTKLAKGLRTKSDDFEIPILLALDSLGGSGNIHDVFNIVEKLMINDLTKSDWQPLPSNPKSLRWKNSVQWARLHLVKEGFLSNTSTKGIWEITESGRTALKDDKKKEK